MAETLPEIWLFLEKLSAGVKAGPSDRRNSDRTVPGVLHSRANSGDRSRRPRLEPHGVVRNTAKLSGTSRGHGGVLLQLDEFDPCHRVQQTVQQWVVFLHDVAKEPLVVATTDIASAQQRSQAHHAKLGSRDRGISIRVRGRFTLTNTATRS